MRQAAAVHALSRLVVRLPSHDGTGAVQLLSEDESRQFVLKRPRCDGENEFRSVSNGVVEPERIDLAASCVGIVRPKARLTLGDKLGAGDAIVLLESSGIHANGISLARKVAERLPDGYATQLDDGHCKPRLDTAWRQRRSRRLSRRAAAPPATSVPFTCRAALTP